MPRVEVRTDEHDLVLERRIGSRNLGDHVVAARVRRLIPNAHLGVQLHRRTMLRQPREHVVVLGRHHDARHRVVLRAAVAEHEDGAVLTLVRTQHEPDAELLQDRHHVAHWALGPPCAASAAHRSARGPRCHPAADGPPLMSGSPSCGGCGSTIAPLSFAPIALI